MAKLHYFEISKSVSLWCKTFRCPFGVRDLSNDECYSGSGKNRCKFFVKYSWTGEYDHHLVCKCNLPKKGTALQLTFNFVFDE